jgi:hypothetical protein
MVQPYREDLVILDAEGILDNESDDSDVENMKWISEVTERRDSVLRSVASSTNADVGSPMIIEDSE